MYIAIPSYNRPDTIGKQTLKFLKDGGVAKDNIYVFVANKAEANRYETSIPKDLYGKIVVGKMGISFQRTFIATYFPIGQYVVSIDDDVDRLEMLSGEKLVKITDVNGFFLDAHQALIKENLFIWGLYPVRNAFFMQKGCSTNLKFIMGGLNGFINRRVVPSGKIAEKEDCELSILYFLKDGGMLRYNDVTIKTKKHARGGLGKLDQRFDANEKASKYLKRKYPDLITIFHRKNGMAEVRFARRERVKGI